MLPSIFSLVLRWSRGKQPKVACWHHDSIMVPPPVFLLSHSETEPTSWMWLATFSSGLHLCSGRKEKVGGTKGKNHPLWNCFKDALEVISTPLCGKEWVMWPVSSRLEVLSPSSFYFSSLFGGIRKRCTHREKSLSPKSLRSQQSAFSMRFREATELSGAVDGFEANSQL